MQLATDKLLIADCLLLSLTLLKAGILFVNYIQNALATNNLAINTALFNGCSYFHDLLFISKIYSSSC